MNKTTRRDIACAAGTNLSAYRTVTIPVLEIEAPVPGPAVALMAGVHGDEWEGQVAVHWLWQQLPRLLRRGKVLLVPVANPEASRAGTRLSPSDGGNLNRAFLGAPARGYTETVAAALEAQVLAKVVYLVDVHSGGASLRYLPSTVVTQYRDDAFDERAMALARAFALPSCLFFNSQEAGAMPSAASRRGVVRLSAEIGGGRDTTHDLASVCRDGLLRCLVQLSMVELDGEMPSDPPALFDLSAPEATLRATSDGVFVPSVHLSTPVTAGCVLADFGEPIVPERPALSIVSPIDGVVVCRRAIARSETGDCLFQIAPELPFSALPDLF
jgi:predicted deacylase